MSESARDLLVHGIAAAQAGSKDEARFYLEWVLHTDSDTGQQIEAWYWLSQVVDDPAEKRNCLENVLAVQPGHAGARRDLAILAGRIASGGGLDPRIPLAPLQPGVVVGAEEVRDHKCPQCGGRLRYDPVAGGVYCQFCGYRQGPPATTPAAGVAEQDWIATMHAPQGHRWELPTQRALTCRHCGATRTMSSLEVSGACPFCGAAQVIETPEHQELIAPEGLIPFQYDGHAAFACARRWLQAQRFRPRDLDERATFVPPRPIYLPFWTFDVSGQIGWSITINANPYQGRVGRPQREEGIQPILCDDLLVPASRSLPEVLLNALVFDTRALVPYDPQYLVHWPAEIYRIAMADASVQVHERIKPTIEQAKDQVRFLHDDMQSTIHFQRAEFHIISYKLVLLPIWMTEYVYKEHRYSVLLNGQTGQGHGTVPRPKLLQAISDL